MKYAKIAALALVALLVLAQLVPTDFPGNPASRVEPAWDSQETRELAVRACYDCHSNETSWPWYASVAPLKWMVRDHVEEARGKLNFSEWDKPQREADEAAEEVADGEMPLAGYALMHSSARLTAAETDALVKGLRATLGGEEGGEGAEEGEEEEEHERHEGRRRDDDDDDD